MEKNLRNRIYINRKFKCSADRLFDWLTKAELIREWFGPLDSVVEHAEANLFEGGKYSIVLKWPDGRNFTIAGHYLKIKKPEELSFSMAYKGLPNNPPKSEISIHLKQIKPHESELTMVQSFEFAPEDFSRRSEAWKMMFDRMAMLISG